jgi:hypothetical protein
VVAAAIVGAAVVGGVGSAVAGSEAAGATKGATNAAVGEQNAALQQQAQLAAPYTGLGQAAIPQYENLLGIGAGGTSGIQAALAQTPGYQFTQQQGETGILNAASAQGGVGGNTLAALDQYNTGLAQGTYQQNLGDIQGAVGLGQAAAAGQASNIGTAAGNISGALINQGNTTAGIDANVAAGLTKAAGGAANNLVEQQTIGALMAQGGGYAGTPSYGGSVTGSNGLYTGGGAPVGYEG